MLDLNQADDAKTYVLTWVDQEQLKCETPDLLTRGTDDDFLRVAKQLFLFCDSRPPMGGPH